jgi:hypothetical protein
MAKWGQVKTLDKTQTRVDRCKNINKSDINCDGVVDALDFNLVMVYWGTYVGEEGRVLKSKTLEELNKEAQGRNN